MAILRHIAVNKLKNKKSLKQGIKAKRKKAGWEEGLSHQNPRCLIVLAIAIKY